MKRFLFGIVGLLLVIGTAGCGCNKKGKNLITVGFSQVGAESDWRVANTESMNEEWLNTKSLKSEMLNANLIVILVFISYLIKKWYLR